MTSHTPEHFSTPSSEDIALAAIMRADAAVWAERNGKDEAVEAIETGRREKIRAARLGTKRSPEVIAKVVAAQKAARARRTAQSKIQPASPPAQPRRKSYG